LLKTKNLEINKIENYFDLISLFQKPGHILIVASPLFRY